jgi:hypothetical protein
VQNEVGIEVGSAPVKSTLGSFKLGTVKNIEIGSIPLGSLDVLVGVLPSVFGKYNISGLLGADTLQMLGLKIDYPEKLLLISKTIVLP